MSETGSGPGSFDIDGFVWHLPYGNPENQLAGQGWSIFNGEIVESLFAWPYDRAAHA